MVIQIAMNSSLLERFENYQTCLIFKERARPYSYLKTLYLAIVIAAIRAFQRENVRNPY